MSGPIAYNHFDAEINASQLLKQFASGGERPRVPARGVKSHLDNSTCW